MIAADIRPTRAEAVYRTLLLLEQTGKIDLGKATETLAAEAMLWRGNPLEADMQKLLAELYFRNRDYRLGFETARQAVAHYPESQPIDELRGREQKRCSASSSSTARPISSADVDALSLYYDFRELTPAGARATR